MLCPHCAATATTEQPRRTVLGYRTFRCPACRRNCNERTGTPYNHLQYPTDLVLLVVLWRLRYKRSLRDLAAMCLARGFVFSHEAVRDWEARFAPLLTDRLRAKRRGRVGAKWHADETYIKVNGHWCSRYRAIDREGNRVEALLSEKRDMAAAQRFFAQALDIAGHVPARVTTDGHDAYTRAIRETLGDAAIHRTSRYKNNRIAQDHRGGEQRCYPMRGFGSFTSAARFCPAFEEQRQYFRPLHQSGERVSLADRRRSFQERWAAVMVELAAARSAAGPASRRPRHPSATSIVPLLTYPTTTATCSAATLSCSPSRWHGARCVRSAIRPSPTPWRSRPLPCVRSRMFPFHCYSRANKGRTARAASSGAADTPYNSSVVSARSAAWR